MPPILSWSSHIPRSLTTRFILGLTFFLNMFVSFLAKKLMTLLLLLDCFLANILLQHGLPESITFDRDDCLISNVWQPLMSLGRVTLHVAFSWHPLTDRAVEVMIRMVENCIRCFCIFEQNDWDQLLPNVKISYNSDVSKDFGISTFEIDLGWSSKTSIDVLFRALLQLEGLTDVYDHLDSIMFDSQYVHRIPKARQAAEVSLHHQDSTYKVSDEVWVHWKLFKDFYSKVRAFDKLSARWFKTFGLFELVSKNAVWLTFLRHICTHPLVDVLHAKPHGSQYVALAHPRRTTSLPTASTFETPLFQVSRILARRRRCRGYQWLMLMKSSNTHGAQCQPRRDFADADGTVTAALHEYVVQKSLLPIFTEDPLGYGWAGNGATVHSDKFLREVVRSPCKQSLTPNWGTLRRKGAWEVRDAGLL